MSIKKKLLGSSEIYFINSCKFNVFKKFKIYYLSRFCVGDKYYLCDNKILCPYDYEERLVFAGLADNPTNLAHMKRQLNNLQVIPFPCWCHSQYVQCEMRKKEYSNGCWCMLKREKRGLGGNKKCKV